MPMINNDQHDVVSEKNSAVLLRKKSGSNMGRGDDASVLIISNALKRKFLSLGGLKSRHAGVGAAWRFEKSWQFCWFPSCVGSEWIPEASGSSLHGLGLEALYVYLPFGANHIVVLMLMDNTPLYTYTFGISIPGNSPGYFSHSVFLKNPPLLISAGWSDFSTTCHANSSHSMMVDSWNRHWPLRRIGFSFWKGKFWINKNQEISDFEQERVFGSVWRRCWKWIKNTHFSESKDKEEGKQWRWSHCIFGCFWKATTMIE